MADLAARLATLIDADTPRLLDAFKDLHHHPELSFAETRTAGIVAATLEGSGFSVTTGIGGTGVVGILHNGCGPTVMYRADMDALPVQEATGLDYASTVAGAAHVCGHDAHVVWLLGLAHLLAATTDAWSGTAVLVAQPAEEQVAGAQAMVDGGLYDVAPKPDALIGLHTAPVPVGLVAAAGGPRMAGSDHVDIVFHGVGGHGSMPQLTKDPVLMAAQAVVEFQSIVSRRISPQETAVLTVGSIQAGTTNNVIPDQALVKANLRWFEPHVRELLLAGISSVCHGIAHGYDLPDDLLPQISVPSTATPLVNDAELTEKVAAALAGVLGEGSVITTLPAVTGSEDCHRLKGPHTDIPLSYLFVGVADPQVYAAGAAEGKLVPYSPHSPDYVVDLAAIPFGVRVAGHTVLELLGATG